MSGNGPAKALASLKPFAGIDAARLSALAGQAMMIRVPRGAVIFDQGEVPTAQVILLEGAVHFLGRIGDGPEMLIQAVLPPDLLLPAAVLEGSPYLLRARAVTECQLLLLPAVSLRSAVATEPSLALGLLSCLARQFRRMTRQVKNLKLRTTTERLACFLLELAERQKAEVVTLPYEKGTIAAELGMTRESLSRALASLEADGVGVQGAEVSIHNRTALLQRCRPDRLIDGPP